jgi:hypothetical protein
LIGQAVALLAAARLVRDGYFDNHLPNKIQFIPSLPGSRASTLGYSILALITANKVLY